VQIREAGAEVASRTSAVADLAKDRKIKISTKGTKEPRFRLDPRASGERDSCCPATADFSPGDEDQEAPNPAAAMRAAKEAADSARGRRRFLNSTMTQEEVLDIFFEDLALPNLVRTTLKDAAVKTWRRAGITTAGSPNQINLNPHHA